MHTKLSELAPAARGKQDVRSRNLVQVWVGILKHCERESMLTWHKLIRCGLHEFHIGTQEVADQRQEIRESLHKAFSFSLSE